VQEECGAENATGGVGVDGPTKTAARETSVTETEIREFLSRIVIVTDQPSALSLDKRGLAGPFGHCWNQLTGHVSRFKVFRTASWIQKTELMRTGVAFQGKRAVLPDSFDHA
jgi:hypothetical protein